LNDSTINDSFGLAPCFSSRFIISGSTAQVRPVHGAGCNAWSRTTLCKKDRSNSCGFIASLCSTQCFRFASTAMSKEEICHVHVVIVQRWYQCIIYGRRGLVRKGMYPMTKQPIKVRRSLCTGEVCVRVACLEAGLFRITLGMKRLSAEIHQPIHRLVCRYPAKEDERT